MPDLPDLHVYAGNLKKYLVGKLINSAHVHNAFKVNKISEVFSDAMAGSSFCDITRNGKELFFHLENKNCLLTDRPFPLQTPRADAK